MARLVNRSLLGAVMIAAGVVTMHLIILPFALVSGSSATDAASASQTAPSPITYWVTASPPDSAITERPKAVSEVRRNSAVRHLRRLPSLPATPLTFDVSELMPGPLGDELSSISCPAYAVNEPILGFLGAGEVDERIGATEEFWPSDLPVPEGWTRGGLAVVRILVNQAGKPVDIRTLASSLETKRLIERINETRFAPAKLNGSPVPSELILRIVISTKIFGEGVRDVKMGKEIDIESRCVSWPVTGQGDDS